LTKSFHIYFVKATCHWWGDCKIQR